MPLVKDKRLLTWLVKYPSETEIRRSRQVKQKLLDGYEKWLAIQENNTKDGYGPIDPVTGKIRFTMDDYLNRGPEDETLPENELARVPMV
jgi:hypothetical protein